MNIYYDDPKAVEMHPISKQQEQEYGREDPTIAVCTSVDLYKND